MSSGASEGTLVTTPVPEEENQRSMFLCRLEQMLSSDAADTKLLQTLMHRKHTGARGREGPQCDTSLGVI